MNHSDNSTEENQAVLTATCAFSLLLVPAVNLHVLVLIVRGGLETVTSECYCLNLAANDVLSGLYCINHLIGKLLEVTIEGKLFCLVFINMSRPMFQGCICVERYLAVVHPVTFLRYKLLRYKVLSCSCVWFLTLALGISLACSDLLNHFFRLLLGFYMLLGSLMLFCSVSALWALKQPGPGEGRCGRREGSGAKRRAFNIIVVTTVTVVINYLPYVLLFLLKDHMQQKPFFSAMGILAHFSVLNGLVNPLFYLHRAAKLPSFTLTFK